MQAKNALPNNIDEYIRNSPEDVRETLKKLRSTIQKAAPKAEEVISYQMPAFKYHGMLVYFAAFKNHIGFYPTSSGIKAFQNEFSDYKWSKGAVQFPMDEPLPLGLISRIVKFRVKENTEKANLKGTGKKS